jgi:hypothetical protein
MSVKTKPEKKIPLPKAVGMWKDRWPKEKNSEDIGRKIRKEQWKRS